MTDKEEEYLTEDLIVRSMMGFGYLKLPQKFKEEYGGVRERKSPKAKLVETNDEIKLTYIWSKKILTPINK